VFVTQRLSRLLTPPTGRPSASRTSTSPWSTWSSLWSTKGHRAPRDGCCATVD
jgi:hypothetical protein